MDESLIDKLKRLIEQHNRHTGERVSIVSFRWFIEIGGKGSVERIEVSIEK